MDTAIWTLLYLPQTAQAYDLSASNTAVTLPLSVGTHTVKSNMNWPQSCRGDESNFCHRCRVPSPWPRPGKMPRREGLCASSALLWSVWGLESTVLMQTSSHHRIILPCLHGRPGCGVSHHPRSVDHPWFWKALGLAAPDTCMRAGIAVSSVTSVLQHNCLQQSHGAGWQPCLSETWRYHKECAQASLGLNPASFRKH